MRKNKTRRHGGAATVFPLRYFDTSAAQPSANEGRDLLTAIPPLGIRPKIGGRRKGKRTTRKSKKQKGGFVPSIMEGFVMSASKYIAPLALFVGYKLLTKKGKKTGNRKKHE